VPFRPFQPIQTDNAEGGSTILDRLMDLVAASFNALANVVCNDTIVKFNLDNTQDWPVTHGLKAVKTWEVVDRDANAVVWRSTAVNTNPSTILLRASAAVNVKLRFM
jgi:hypothetical protein